MGLDVLRLLGPYSLGWVTIYFRSVLGPEISQHELLTSTEERRTDPVEFHRGEQVESSFTNKRKDPTKPSSIPW